MSEVTRRRNRALAGVSLVGHAHALDTVRCPECSQVMRPFDRKLVPAHIVPGTSTHKDRYCPGSNRVIS